MNWNLIVLTLESKNIEVFNFNQAFSKQEDEEGYAPLENIEDNYVGIEEEPDH